MIELLDRGEANRTYCYISDATYMLWRILLEGTDPVYNVGGVSSTTIADLARLIGKLLHVPVRIPEEGKGGLVGAPSDTQLDLTRFQEQFGTIDFTDLTTGVARVVEWQSQFYGS